MNDLVELLAQIGEEPISGVWLRPRLERIVERLAVQFGELDRRAMLAEREVRRQTEALVDLRDAHERMRRMVSGDGPRRGPL